MNSKERLIIGVNVDGCWKPHVQPDHDLKAVIPKQRPVVPTLKASPVLLQCIREANPFLAVDKEFDGLRAMEHFLLSGRFEDLLGRQFASGSTVVSLGIILVFTPGCGVRIGGLYGLFHVRWMDWLKRIMLTSPRWKRRGTNLGLDRVDPCGLGIDERVTTL